MDYLKILNQHNNTPTNNLSTDKLNQILPKVEKSNVDIVDEKNVSICITIQHDIVPVEELNSIIENLGNTIKLINIFILYTGKFEIDAKLGLIKHSNVYAHKVFSHKYFNINIIDEIVSDSSDYILYTHSDYILEDSSYIEKSIRLMQRDPSIIKVGSSYDISKYSELSSKNLDIDGILYKTYVTKDIVVDGDKSNSKVSVSNFIGADFSTGLIKKSIFSLLKTKEIQFYNFNSYITYANKKVVCLINSGMKHQRCINNIKVSFIMQAFLGDYPGARTNPVDKFHRVMGTILNNKNIELIVVSDGCDLVDLEIQQYLNDDRVKYAFISKSNERMYEGNQGDLFYRGVPRQVGLELATGDIVTYVDSDDIVLPNASAIIANEFYKTNLKYMFNSSWFDHIDGTLYHKKIETHYVKPESSFRIGENTFIKVGVLNGFIHYAPWLQSHIRDIKTKWKDVKGRESEDIIFGRSLTEEVGNNAKVIDAPYYVRCHLKNYFDV